MLEKSTMSINLASRAVGLNKFKGALVGALLGDCLGAPFEGEPEPPASASLQKYFDDLESSPRGPVKEFTDDTAMTRGILDSFVELGSFDENDVARRFVNNYYREPNRGYGESVVTVFKKLRQAMAAELKSGSEVDIWKPARAQFNGSGSLGNGGAMRIAPVALFCCSNYNLMLSTAEKCTKITHTHELGINGALLQVIAVWKALKEDSNQPLDVHGFLSDIIEKMAAIEQKNDHSGEESGRFYVAQLKEVNRFLLDEHTTDEDIIDNLGTSIKALYSVPTALYCFLRALRPIKSIKTDNGFRRTIQYSISLGGDTDTIASMAGAIAGAFYGIENINENLRSHCEEVEKTLQLAEDLYNVTPI